MTCKDCIHNEVCCGTHTDDSPTCCDFKDKSRFIELPCNVGAEKTRRAKFECIQDGKGVCSNCHRLDFIDNLAKYCRYCGAKLEDKQ